VYNGALLFGNIGETIMRHAVESALLIALVVTAIIIKELAEIGIYYLIISVIVVVVAYAIYVFIQYKTASTALRHFPWLYPLSAKGIHSRGLLDHVERLARPYSTIYLVTPDLYNDARVSTTQDVVMHNLTRGITYKYLTRDDNETAQSNFDEVLHKFASHAELVHIFSINELFDLLPTCNILVIEHDETDRLRVFVELPVLENNMRFWWVEADHIVARQWHRKVLQVLKNREPAENPYKKSLATL
jgi:hypothetical protein